MDNIRLKHLYSMLNCIENTGIAIVAADDDVSNQ